MARKTNAEILRPLVARELNMVQEAAKGVNSYLVAYIHSWEQGDGEGKNLLVVPNDPRFEEFECYGMIIDMVRTYADKTGIELKGNLAFKSFIDVLTKVYKGKI